MKKLLAAVLALVLIAQAGAAMAAGLAPWQFGMSKEQVAGFAEFGPYRSFKNGDLETYAGLWDGRKENIQFFFDERGLRRVGIYVYEGKSVHDAAAGWRKAYDSLAKNFGAVELPNIHIEPGSDPVTSEVLAIAAGANTDATGKTQMAPVKQPPDMFVFSSFFRAVTEGEQFYYVVIYFDRPS